jgi:hypothetical protein
VVSLGHATEALTTLRRHSNLKEVGLRHWPVAARRGRLTVYHDKLWRTGPMRCLTMCYGPRPASVLRLYRLSPACGI